MAFAEEWVKLELRILKDKHSMFYLVCGIQGEEKSNESKRSYEPGGDGARL